MADSHSTALHGDVTNNDGIGLTGNNIHSSVFNFPDTAKVKAEIWKALGAVDPQAERLRILYGKDKLLDGSSEWIFDDDAFKSWYSGERDSKIFWIHGDPGKGKTMIFESILKELDRRRHSSSDNSKLEICFFYCQRSSARLNNIEAVVKGLAYSLLARAEDKQTAMFKYLEDHLIRSPEPPILEEQEQAAPYLTFWKYWSILEGLIKTAQPCQMVLMVDALDELQADSQQLVDCITKSQESLPAYWILTSRNEPYLREVLEYGQEGLHTSLELNSRHVERAVEHFIHVKVQELQRRKRYSKSLSEEVAAHLMSNAQGTFLWVALVCQALFNVKLQETKSTLRSFPAGLENLYDEMLRLVENQGSKEHVGLCLKILQTVAVAGRHLTIQELAIFCHMQGDEDERYLVTEDIVSHCGSFIGVQSDETVRFIHQSCSDFFHNGRGSRIFPRATEHHHAELMNDCFSILNTHHEGRAIDQHDGLYYAMFHWPFHLKMLVQVLFAKESGGSLHDHLKTSNSVEFFDQNWQSWIKLIVNYPPEEDIAPSFHRVSELSALIEGLDGTSSRKPEPSAMATTFLESMHAATSPATQLDWIRWVVLEEAEEQEREARKTFRLLTEAALAGLYQKMRDQKQRERDAAQRAES